MTQQTAIDEQQQYPGTQQVLNLEYRYAAGQNNGRITQMKDWLSGEEVTYTYDTLNRLIQAVTTGPEYGLNWSYDGFGNLTSQQLFKGTGYNTNLSYNGLTNRITTPGYSYDANGNLTAMPSLTMQYDVQNRMISSTHATGGSKRYAYAPNGQRVAESDPPSSDYESNSWWIYFYGPDGRLVAGCGARYVPPDPQYPQTVVFPATCGTAYVYFGGKLVRKESKPQLQGGLWVYPRGVTLAADRLGSMRYQQGASTIYYPYGEERTPTTNDTQKFATYTRDSATGLDYANARYYSSQIARFTTADPNGTSPGPKDPQNWNRYAYTNGDPVNASDPQGLQSENPNDIWPCFFGGTWWPSYMCALPRTRAPLITVDEWDDTRGKPTKHDRQQARAAAMLQAAINAALMVLQSSADCRALFAGTDLLGNRTPDPVAFLFAMEENINAWAFFQVADLPREPGVVRSATTGPSGQTVTVDIGNGATQGLPVIQVTINDLEGNFRGSSLSSATTTVLHELGHVYYDLFGPNTTRIVSDAASTALSEQNQKMVADTCGLQP